MMLARTKKEEKKASEWFNLIISHNKQDFI